MIFLQYPLALLLMCCLQKDAAALSNPRFPISAEKHLDRRGVIAQIGSGTAAITGSFLVPTTTNARESISTDPATFDTYNIIPDPSADLMPKLQKVDVSAAITSVVRSLLPVCSYGCSLLSY